MVSAPLAPNKEIMANNCQNSTQNNIASDKLEAVADHQQRLVGGGRGIIRLTAFHTTLPSVF